nr:MAG TPA: hypothetical protein [Caudoviricetes sp.]
MQRNGSVRTKRRRLFRKGGRRLTAPYFDRGR